MIAKANLINKINQEGFQKYFKNTFWLFLEKVLRLISALVIGVLVARYLGPEDFGLLNYAMSLVSFFIILSALGLDNILVKELLLHADYQAKILGTAFVLKLFASLLLLIFLTIAIVMSDNTFQLNLIIIILAVSTIFRSFNVIEFYFQAKVQSKFVVFSNIISLILIALFKLYLIYVNADLILFAMAFSVDALIVTIGFLYFYKNNGLKLKEWTFSMRVAKSLLLQSWPLILSGIVITIYMKIDQIMIKEMIGATANGNYAAAVKISEAWYFIPMVICNSLFPAIVNSKNREDGSYEKRLQSLFDLMIMIALFVAVPITFVGEELILFLYGESYSDAIDVLTIHVWSGIFVALGFASGKWFINENLQRLTFYRSLIGAIFNVLLNLLLIPKYGIKAAALTTLFSQFLAAFLFDLLFSKTRALFRMKLKSLLLFNIIKTGINVKR